MLRLVQLAQLGVALAVSPAAAADRAQPAPSHPSFGTSLSINDALKRASALDPRIHERLAEQVRRDVLARRARWDQVRGNAGVQAGHAVGMADLLSTNSDTTSSSSDRLSASVFADLRVPLWTGGAISSAIDSADARVQQSQWQTVNLQQQVKCSVLRSYAFALASEQQVEVAEKALQRSDLFVALAKSRRDTGVGLSSDVARSQLNRLRRQEDLVSQQSQCDQAFAMLRSALLLEAKHSLSLSDSLDTLHALQAQEPIAHPMVAEAQADHKAASADLSLARAGYHPTVEVFANVLYGNGMFYSSPGALGPVPMPGPADRRVGDTAGAASAGVMLTWKVFDMFVTRDRIDQADASRVAASARVDQAQREVQSQLAQALVREQRARQRVQLLRGGTEIAREAVRLARVRYETGNAILTEVLDAELEGTSVESRAVQAAYDLAVAHVDRLQAEGRRL